MAGGLRGVSCRPPSDLTSDIGPATALALGDIDGDGDVDLFKSAGPSQQAQLLLNAGNGSFHLEPESPDEATGAALLDLENDGDLDLVTAQPTLPYNNRSNGLLTPYDEAPAMRGETVVVLDYLAWMVRRTCCSLLQASHLSQP